MPHNNELIQSEHQRLLIFMIWFSLATSSLATLTKLASKLTLRSRFQKDDWFMLCATVRLPDFLNPMTLAHIIDMQLMALGHSISVHQQIVSGLGQHMDTLSESHLSVIEKVLLSVKAENTATSLNNRARELTC